LYGFFDSFCDLGEALGVFSADTEGFFCGGCVYERFSFGDRVSGPADGDQTDRSGKNIYLCQFGTGLFHYLVGTASP